MTETLLELQNLTVIRHLDPAGFFGLWGAKPLRALDGISLTVHRGETLGIMGGSGSGKTTLAESAVLHRRADRGRILLNGQDVDKLSGSERRKAQRRLQLISQDPREGMDADRTVRKQVSDQLRAQGIPDAEPRLHRAMQQVELPTEFLDRRPTEMSGGQLQRVALARALVMGPLLIAADEPLSGVDPRLQQEMIALMKRVQQGQGIAYLVISQDPRVILKLAHRVAVLFAGRLFEVGPTDEVLSRARHPYSRGFLGLEPGLLPPEEDMAGRVFAGCPWVPHCQLATERCQKEMPAAREATPGHVAACHAL